jgi:hypothetical protein
MATGVWRFHGVSGPAKATRGVRGQPAKGIRMTLITPGGQLREVPLTRTELLDVAARALEVARRLDRAEAEGRVDREGNLIAGGDV